MPRSFMQEPRRIGTRAAPLGTGLVSWRFAFGRGMLNLGMISPTSRHNPVR